MTSDYDPSRRIPPRWLAYINRSNDAASSRDKTPIAKARELITAGVFPESWAINVCCGSCGRRIVEMELVAEPSGNPGLGPRAIPRSVSGHRVYDVVTGSIDDDTTTDQRFSFVCVASRHGADKPKYIRRRRSLLAEAIRTAMLGQHDLILGDTPKQTADPDDA
jgi:hypothetical protein